MTETVGRIYAGQSADERDAARRARLLEATHELVGKHGYAAMTVERICSLAKVSTRHFYLLYDNKEAVLLDLFDNLIGRSYADVLESLKESEGKSLPERIPAAFMAYLRPMLKDVRTARIVFVEVLGVSPRFEEKRLQYRESLIALVESEGAAAVDRGEVADRDFRFAGIALVGAGNAIVYDWAIRKPRPPVAEIEQKLSDLAIKILTG